MKLLIITASIALLAYLGIVAFVYFTQDRMIYFPMREIEQTPRNAGLPYEEITLRTKDGLTIAGWYVHSTPEQAVLIYCHGNGGNISHRLDRIRIFHDLGLSVLIFDYRGYGMSQGRPFEEGTYLDAEAAWDYLVSLRGKDPRDIVIFGKSLGAAVAAELALRRPSGALIMEAGFTSLPDLGQKFYPWLPVRLLTRHRYASAAKVGSIRSPKLIVHSPGDEIVPYDHGRILFEKSSEPKEFLQTRGDHNGGFLVSGYAYIDGLRGFLTRHVRGYGKESDGGAGEKQ